jgi:hypothetical protein
MRGVLIGLFYIWGVTGLFATLIRLADMKLSGSVDVATSTYAAAIALMWIGGMLFFFFCEAFRQFEDRYLAKKT